MGREEGREEKPTEASTGANIWEKSEATTDGCCIERGD